MSFPIQLLCLICHEPVRIPVSMKSVFACKSKKDPDGPGCNDMVRTCYPCCSAYLEMDNPKEKSRSKEKKCLLCPQTCNPREIKTEIAHWKDYLFMSMDPRNDYPCFQEKCSFQGTQLELDRHWFKECPYKSVQCLCGERYCAITDSSSHFSTCPYYISCTVCKEWILKDHYKNHLKQLHQMVPCCHYQCEFIGKEEEIGDHETECPFRKIKCPFCYFEKSLENMPNHILTHWDQGESRLYMLKGDMEEAKDYIKRVSNFYYSLERKI